MSENLLIDKKNGYWDVTINRPKVLNALNPSVIAELTDVVAAARKDVALRALVLRGAGDKAFVAGADIAAMREMAPEQALMFGRKGQELTLALEDAPFITIAVVQGFALGGGCELAMACDVVIASTAAKFGQPETDLGLIAGFGGTQRLVKRVGMPVAMDMLCCGRKINGTEAFQLGLAARVAAPEQLEAEVESTLKGILRAAPGANSETKRLIHDAMEMPLRAGLAAEATGFATRFAGTEAKEGISAFLEKRKAQFSL